MTKSKKNLAIVVALITLLVALGSVFAIFGIFAKPTKMVEAAETRAPGLYETGTTTPIKSWQQLLDDGDITKVTQYLGNGTLIAYESFRCSQTLVGDLICGKTNETITSLSESFIGCDKLTLIDCNNFDTSNVKYMDKVFSGCSSAISIKVDKWNTNNVVSMQDMFQACFSITTLNLANFNTNSVTNMKDMFLNCFSLTSLDLSNFGTSSVTQMTNMFGTCTSLTSLNLSNFETSDVTEMRAMFNSCSSLTSLNLTNFNTSKVTDMSSMFAGCSSLRALDLGSFDTRSITNMDGMFIGCSFNTLTLGKNFVITSDCTTENTFSNPETIINIFVKDDALKQKAILDISNPEGRLAALCEATDGLPPIEVMKEYGIYDMYVAMLSDSQLNTIVCPQLEDGVTVTLAPASNHIYAFTDDDTRAPVESITSKNWKNEKGEARTLKLYYKDDPKTEVPPISSPDTPSDTGVVADISMIIITLASILSLTIVATKKKRYN